MELLIKFLMAMNSSKSDLVLQKMFELTGRDSWHWLLLAKDLAAIAEETWKNRDRKPEPAGIDKMFVIGREHSRTRIAFALLGMAFENLFKAVILRRHPDYIQNGEFTKDFPKTHNLGRLAEKCDHVLRPEEVFLLQRITPYIYWFAKYPVPTSSDQLEIVELDGIDFERGDLLPLNESISLWSHAVS